MILPDLSYKGVIKIQPLIHFCAWILLDFLVQKNLDNFVDYLGYYKNYFGSTAEVIILHECLRRCGTVLYAYIQRYKEYE